MKRFINAMFNRFAKKYMVRFEPELTSHMLAMMDNTLHETVIASIERGYWEGVTHTVEHLEQHLLDNDELTMHLLDSAKKAAPVLLSKVADDLELLRAESAFNRSQEEV